MGWRVGEEEARRNRYLQQVSAVVPKSNFHFVSRPALAPGGILHKGHRRIFMRLTSVSASHFMLRSI